MMGISLIELSEALVVYSLLVREEIYYQATVRVFDLGVWFVCILSTAVGLLDSPSIDIVFWHWNGVFGGRLFDVLFDTA